MLTRQRRKLRPNPRKIQRKGWRRRGRRSRWRQRAGL